jgi:hypothetical protein
MQAMRDSWTDDHLDYLNQELVSQRFDMIESRLERMDARLDTRLEKIDARFEKSDDARFEKSLERFDAMHRLIIQGGLGLFGALFVAFLTFLATHF